MFHLHKMGARINILKYINKSITYSILTQHVQHGMSTTSANIEKALVSTPSTEKGSKVLKSLNTSKMSKAMKSYLERAQAHDIFMNERITEYEIGRRHLANMMGENPETFMQEDIDKAILYLFPSGLFEPRARPVMKHPYEVFPKRKAAEFDESGRPFHSLFYTGQPAYYQVLHDIAEKIKELDYLASKKMHLSVQQDIEPLNLGGTQWVSKKQLEEIIMEDLKDKHYEFFIKSMNRLATYPYSCKIEDYLLKFRRKSVVQNLALTIPKVMYDEDGVPYMTAEGKRKTSRSNVIMYGQGSGKITINGLGINYFQEIQDREQVLFPLQFCKLLGCVDIKAVVENGGQSGQSGALRYAIALACQSFVDKEMVEKMRLAGLLTRDVRSRERKKPGQKGARAKFTWKKR